MDRYLLYLVLFAVSMCGLSYFFIQADAGREMSIPPTNAFSKIVIGNQTITANGYNSLANLTGKIAGSVVGNGSISCGTVSGVTTCKLKAISCPVLQGIKGIDANGNLFCSTL